MEINTQTLKLFRGDFQNAVSELEKKYNLSINIGNISYTTDGFHTKLTATKTDESHERIDNSWSENALFYGLDATWQGKTFTPRASNEALKIVGLNLRRPKNPCELVGVTSGKKFKSTVDFVKFNMNNVKS
jgi:hypothetical protein